MLDRTTDLKAMLSDPSLLEARAYVNGQFIDGDDGTFEVTNPRAATSSRRWLTCRARRSARPWTTLSKRRKNGPAGPARSVRRCCANGST